jgi:hypothetical protein
MPYKHPIVGQLISLGSQTRWLGGKLCALHEFFWLVVQLVQPK